MLQAVQIRKAADEIMASALLGTGWDAALSQFAEAAEARDAVLMRNNSHHLVTAMATPEAAEAVADFAAGKAPPNSRYARVRSSPVLGFRFDHDDYGADELARDPFYQEFLRPRGVFWHANVVLAASAESQVELSLKRRIAAGHYGRADAAALDHALPSLRAAARVAKHTLDAEAHGMEWLLAQRGTMVIELDAHGLVMPGQAGGEQRPHAPLRIRRRRLLAADPKAQPALDDALAVALLPSGYVSLALLSGSDGRRYILQLHRIPGRARDVFLSATAIAVLIERDPPRAAMHPHRLAAQSLFGLTDREATVAVLLAQGFALPAIAESLHVHTETVRTHLKAVFEKTGTSRQAELVRLLHQLSS